MCDDAGNTTVSPKNIVLGTCPAGSFKTGPGDCDVCKPGYFIAPGDMDLHDKTACDSCPPGLFEKEKNSTRCKPCESGSFFAGSGASECTKCAQGYFQKEREQTSCNECAAGFFASNPGQSYCGNCDDSGDVYQDEKAKSVCKRCPEFTMRYPRAT